MKWPLVLVIVAAFAFLVWHYWPEIAPKVDSIVGLDSGTAASDLDIEYTPPAYAPGVTQAPRTGRIAPPGVVYMLERVSQRTDSGVVAIVPGEEVRIMQKKKSGVIRVTTGRHDFEVKPAQVTKDYDLAQEARLREAAMTQ